MRDMKLFKTLRLKSANRSMTWVWTHHKFRYEVQTFCYFNTRWSTHRGCKGLNWPQSNVREVHLNSRFILIQNFIEKRRTFLSLPSHLCLIFKAKNKTESDWYTPTRSRDFLKIALSRSWLSVRVHRHRVAKRSTFPQCSDSTGWMQPSAVSAGGTLQIPPAALPCAMC